MSADSAAVGRRHSDTGFPARPRISIITPSYNQAAYLEQCIDSIVGQNYANLEHLVFDGGSDDGSMAILKRHQKAFGYWQSRRDEGQADAINQGLLRASGDILCWVNSDDGLLPGTLELVAASLPADKPAWLVGESVSVDPRGKRVKQRHISEVSQRMFLRYKEFWLPQPSVFWNRAMHDKTGLLDAGLRYIMDLDLFYRMYRVAGPVVVRQPLSFYRVHSQAKTTAEASRVDEEYGRWLARRVTEGDLQLDRLLGEFIYLQRCHRTVLEHSVLSRIVSFWKRYVNPRLRV